MVVVPEPLSVKASEGIVPRVFSWAVDGQPGDSAAYAGVFIPVQRVASPDVAAFSGSGSSCQRSAAGPAKLPDSAQMSKPKLLVKQFDWVRLTVPSNSLLPKYPTELICSSTLVAVSPGSTHAQNEISFMVVADGQMERVANRETEVDGPGIDLSIDRTVVINYSEPWRERQPGSGKELEVTAKLCAFSRVEPSLIRVQYPWVPTT